MTFLKRLYASLMGYFALPCPTCGEEFYGFQQGRCDSVPSARAGFHNLICPKCSREGKGVGRRMAIMDSLRS